jgi:hypothetical protein
MQLTILLILLQTGAGCSKLHGLALNLNFKDESIIGD